MCFSPKGEFFCELGSVVRMDELSPVLSWWNSQDSVCIYSHIEKEKNYNLFDSANACCNVGANLI